MQSSMTSPLEGVSKRAAEAGGDGPVLVVDDSPSTRRLIAGLIAGWGRDVRTAADGAEAWRILEREPVRLVVTDWVMPEVDGEELCRRIRATRHQCYRYVIALTQRDASDDLVACLEAGADDYIAKPFEPAELHARLEAGLRVVRLERRLATRNRQLSAANEELARARAAIERDLIAATKVQRRLLPRTPRRLHGWEVASLFVPSTWISGDLFGFFPLDERHFAFYHLDVAGHGVAAALASAALSSELTPDHAGPEGRRRLAEPLELVAHLNATQPCDDEASHFTIVYGVLDSLTGTGRLVQAGHPHPIVVEPGGGLRQLGRGGLPIGLFDDAEHEEEAFRLAPGERLFLCSDGLADADAPDGRTWGEERLRSALSELRELPLSDCLDGLRERLRAWRGCDDQDDDVSVLALEAPPNPPEEA